MKAPCVVLFLLAAGIPLASGGELTLSTGIDWMAGVRGGFEWLFLPRSGIQAHAGVSIGGAATGDLLIVHRLFAGPRGFSLRLLAGIPNALFPFGASELMVSLGAAVESRWRLARGIGLSVRAGEGYPFFFAQGQYASKAVRYPFGLWPDLFLGLWFEM